MGPIKTKQISWKIKVETHWIRLSVNNLNTLFKAYRFSEWKVILCYSLYTRNMWYKKLYKDQYWNPFI